MSIMWSHQRNHPANLTTKIGHLMTNLPALPAHTRIDYERALGVLKRARERISSIDHWTTGVQARDAFGDSCLPISPRAVRWCAMGALNADMLDPSPMIALPFLRECTPPDAGGNVLHVNDYGPYMNAHRRVLDMYDRAIQMLEDHLATR